MNFNIKSSYFISGKSLWSSQGYTRDKGNSLQYIFKLHTDEERIAKACERNTEEEEKQ